MQIKTEQLLRQQMILRFLGYYKGKLDGIWAGMTIEAKKAFERDKKFAPAFPNNGLPFADKDTYPKGIGYDRATRLLTCVGLSETVIAEYTALQAESNRQYAAVAAKTTSVAEVTPPVETPTPPAESVETVTPEQRESVEAVPKQTTTTNAPQHTNKQTNQHHNYNKRG